MNRRLIGLLAAGSLTLLGACGGGDGVTDSDPVTAASDKEPGESSPLDLVLASAARATEATTTRFEFTMTLDGPERVNLTATGASDNSVPVMGMELDMASIIPGTPAGGATVATVFDGKSVYMRFPEELAAGLPGGKRWVRIDLASISSEAGIDADALAAQFNSSDPLANISLLTGASDDVTEVGTEEVRGVSTRHLKMTVNLQRATEHLNTRLSGPNAEQLKKAVAQAAATVGVTELPMEAWIDEDGLPRRILYTLDLAQAQVPGAEAATGTATIKMEFFDFGEDLDVAIPSPEETTDFAELLGSF